MSREPIRHLYVHVPFCPTICPFCSFHVVERRRGVVAAYLGEIERELAELADRFDIELDTVYFGGGTPSHVRTREFADLLASIRYRFAADRVAEITLEAHPSDVTAVSTRAWRDLGVTRLSVGVQSTDDVVLRRLGRNHSAARAIDAVEHAVEAGFDIVNADVITAVEGQDVAADLARVVALGVDSVSAYTLTIEPGTPFARDGVVVDVDHERRAFDTARDVLGAAGFEHYEVSNHARPGRACRHNRAYWANRTYVGIGPGATSHLPAPTDGDWITERLTNANLDEWLTGDRGSGDRIDARTFWAESMLAGLRSNLGADLEAIADIAGPIPVAVSTAIDDAENRRWCRRVGPAIVPTSDGMRVHNRLAELFV